MFATYLQYLAFDSKRRRLTMTFRIKDGTGSREKKSFFLSVSEGGKNMRERIGSVVLRLLKNFDDDFESQKYYKKPSQITI